ncbi:MAG: hypothetical protein J5867_04735 [Prevotella sp.]|nr:hypothetical protein [Prevotella sp.]
MAFEEYPILMNDYSVWLDRSYPFFGFSMDVWMAEYQLKEMAWWNEDILLLIKEFDCQLVVEV